MSKNHNTFVLCFLLLYGFTSALYSQNKLIPLWKNVPNSIENKSYTENFRKNEKGEINAVRNVKTPTLKLFLLKNDKKDNSAVVIFPGGGYSVLSHIKEGEKVAMWLNSIGVSALVLKYRLPSDVIMQDKTIGPLQDAQESIRMVRRNAEKWNINPNKIGVIGFSAGGHLAATLSTQYDRNVYESDSISARPDFSALIYPVISMKDSITHKGSKTRLLGKYPSDNLVRQYSNEKQVNSSTPPTFLIHATDDVAVPVENSIDYYFALKKVKVLAEMHLYNDGGHGFGLGRTGTHATWPLAFENWLHTIESMSHKKTKSKK